jgi:hypothetical protein
MEMVDVPLTKVCADCGQHYLPASYRDISACPGCEVACSYCGEVVRRSEAGTIGKDEITLYCEDCRVRLHDCEHCGGLTRDDEGQEYNGQWYCEDCAGDMLSTCDDCEDVVLADEVHVIGEDVVCDTCLRRHYDRCNDCGEWFRSDEDCGGPGRYLCRTCYEAGNYFVCEGCGCVVHGDHWGGEGYCEACYSAEDEDDEDALVHGHEYKPRPCYFAGDE